jgi:hypothetical protein
MAMVSCNSSMLPSKHYSEVAIPRAFLEAVAEEDIVRNPKAGNDDQNVRLCNRMNSKNNRRVMKRLAGWNRVAQGASSEVFADGGTSQLAHPPAPLGHWDFGHSNEIMEPGNVNFIRLRYIETGSDDCQQSVTNAITLVAFNHASLPAFVDVSAEKQGALEEHIEFRVEPTLPEGLTLHERTGFISGTPSKAQETPSVHTITISIAATGKGNVPLGKIALTSCRIVIGIVHG